MENFHPDPEFVRLLAKHFGKNLHEDEEDDSGKETLEILITPHNRTDVETLINAVNNASSCSESIQILHQLKCLSIPKPCSDIQITVEPSTNGVNYTMHGYISYPYEPTESESEINKYLYHLSQLTQNLTTKEIESAQLKDTINNMIHALDDYEEEISLLTLSHFPDILTFGEKITNITESTVSIGGNNQRDISVTVPDNVIETFNTLQSDKETMATQIEKEIDSSDKLITEILKNLANIKQIKQKVLSLLEKMHPEFSNIEIYYHNANTVIMTYKEIDKIEHDVHVSNLPTSVKAHIIANHGILQTLPKESRNLLLQFMK